MANNEHIELIRESVGTWNGWRKRNPNIIPNLRGASLFGANLTSIDLHNSDLSEACLHSAALRGAILRGSDLRKADLSEARLDGVQLQDADMCNALLCSASLLDADCSNSRLSGAHLNGASLERTVFDGANLRGADLQHAVMVNTQFKNADLRYCKVFGTSVWDVCLDGAIQSDIVITSGFLASSITVDNIEVAQFLYLLLNNTKIRQVLDTITSKVVLILGRFTPERKKLLDALRNALRSRGYLPVLFDFEKPNNRDVTETVTTLAHMARFVIADITDARSIPQELSQIVPNLPSVPVQPLLQTGSPEYGMFEHFKRYPWVLQTYLYDDLDSIISNIESKIIHPAETKVIETHGDKK